MMWSKQKEKMNYFIKYNVINKMKDEFTNSIFRDDLLQLYKEKVIAKKKIIQENITLQNLKKISSDSKFLKVNVRYEKDYQNKKIIPQRLKYRNIKNIAFRFIRIKKIIKRNKWKYKYQYLKKYPEVIKKVDDLSQKIIEKSLDTQKQINEYILAKQKIITFKYSDKNKIEEAQKLEKEKAEEEIKKIIGNSNFEF